MTLNPAGQAHRLYPTVSPNRSTVEMWFAVALQTQLPNLVIWAPSYSAQAGLSLPDEPTMLVECGAVRYSGSTWIDKRKLDMYKELLPHDWRSLCFVLPRADVHLGPDSLAAIDGALSVAPFEVIENHVRKTGRGTLRPGELDELITASLVLPLNAWSIEGSMSTFKSHTLRWAPRGPFGARPTPISAASNYRH